MQKYLVILLAVQIIVPLPASLQAACLKRSKESLDMCLSKAPVEGLNKEIKDITQRFNPANGRMSPESCQGFSEAYSKYKSLVEKYIDACWNLVDDTDQACTEELKAEKTTEKLVEGVEALKVWRKSHEEAPKLEQYLKPMDTLKARLDDCLKDAKGKSVVNSNTDRGNANTQGQIPKADASSAQNGSPHGGEIKGGAIGLGITSSPDRKDLSREPGNCVDLGNGKSSPCQGDRNDPGKNTKTSNTFRPASKQTREESLTSPFVQPAPIDTTVEADLFNKGKFANIHRRLVQLIARRPATDGSTDGITGPHTNLFQKIRNRYQNIRSRSELND